jgi:glucan biosynthesis protein C
MRKALLVYFNMWFWIVALLGYGQKYLSFSNRLLRYASEAAYPFYILHQTIIILVGYYVVQWNIGVWPKFLIIGVAALIGTLLVYDLAVRRTNLTRFLFGMKPLPRVELTRVVQQPA